MSKKDKLLKRFLAKPIKNDLTFDELETLLVFLDYQKIQGSGSRVKFYHKLRRSVINLHKPHPNNALKVYLVKQIQEKLKELL